MTEINFALLQQLATKPHPLLRDLAGDDLPDSVNEILVEARTAHHLLDIVEIPHGEGQASDLDARVWQAVNLINALGNRLSRIAAWHERETADGGMVGDYCTECGEVWPCETRRMADGTHEDGCPDPWHSAADQPGEPCPTCTERGKLRPVRYRVGNHQPQNIYRGDQYIGVMFSPIDAATVVRHLNAGLGERTSDSYVETVHLLADGSATTSCCRRTPFVLPRMDRVTGDPRAVTCQAFMNNATNMERS